MIDPADVAILTVHGNGPDYTGEFAEQYSWPKLQIEMVRRHTPAGYTVVAYGNDIIEPHEEFLRSCSEVELHTTAEPTLPVLEHVWPARNWLVEEHAPRFKYLVTLDSDAFPVRDGWLDRYLGDLTDEQPLVAVQRLENGDTHSDRSFIAFTSDAWRTFRFDFSMVGVTDAGGKISRAVERAGRSWRKLNRTNAWNPHPIVSAIYDDHIYHHGAGSRLPRFRQNQDIWDDPARFDHETQLHRALLRAIHTDPHDYLRLLRSRQAPSTRFRPGMTSESAQGNL